MKSGKVLGLLRDAKAYVWCGKVQSGTESGKVGGRDNGTIRLGLKCWETGHLEVSKGSGTHFFVERDGQPIRLG